MNVHLEFFPPLTKEQIPVIVTPVHMARFKTSRLRSSLMALKSEKKAICIKTKGVKKGINYLQRKIYNWNKYLYLSLQRLKQQSSELIITIIISKT